MPILWRMNRSTPLAATAAVVILGLGLPMAQAETRGTTQDDVLAAALLPGWQMDSGAHMAGLRLDLAPGWKTYWRSPGDAGIPPQFDWSGSTNLKSVVLHWPSPTVFHTNGYATIGYKGGLVLPVEVEARDPSRPVTLRASVELGICRDICMPAYVELSAEIVTPGAPDAAIRAALKARPASASEAGVAKVSCTVDPIEDGLRITATIRLPQQPGEETVAFETADPHVWVGEAQSERIGNALVSVAEMVGPSGQPFALDRSAMTLTVISSGGAVEIQGCPAP